VSATVEQAQLELGISSPHKTKHNKNNFTRKQKIILRACSPSEREALAAPFMCECGELE
jgi:hypothetical protein